MSRKIRSLLVKSAHIQRAIDAEHERRTVDWIRLLRLKVLRLKLMRRLVAAVRPEPLAAMAQLPLPALAARRPRGLRAAS